MIHCHAIFLIHFNVVEKSQLFSFFLLVGNWHLIDKYPDKT
jgi:hypothetical protein